MSMMSSMCSYMFILNVITSSSGAVQQLRCWNLQWFLKLQSFFGLLGKDRLSLNGWLYKLVWKSVFKQKCWLFFEYILFTKRGSVSCSGRDVLFPSHSPKIGPNKPIIWPLKQTPWGVTWAKRDDCNLRSGGTCSTRAFGPPHRCKQRGQLEMIP